MRKEFIFNNGHNGYSIDKYYFQKDKKNLVNINEVDIDLAPYGEQGSYKYYIGYLEATGVRPLHIIIKKK